MFKLYFILFHLVGFSFSVSFTEL